MMSRHFAQALRFALRTAGALRDTAPQPPTRLSNMSFLDDLKQQAKAREAQLRGDLAVIERHCAQVEEACQTVWRYLDDLGRQLELLDYVRLLNDEGVTILAAMHDLQLIPGVFSSVLLLGPDQEVRKGDPQDLLQPDILERAFDCPPRRHPKLVAENRFLLEKIR